MTVPQYLDSSVYPLGFSQKFGLADVETGGVGIITALRDLLVTTLGWTEPSTNLFKTPVDAAGRFLDVLVTRISATALDWRVRNAAAATVCTRRVVLGTGYVHIFGSTAGVVVEAIGSPNHELTAHCFAHLLDMSPNVPGDHVLYVYGGGRYNTSGTDDNTSASAGQGYCIDNGAAASLQRAWAPFSIAGVVANFFTSMGRPYFCHYPIYINFAATVRAAGIIPHALMGTTQLRPGDERNMWLDENTYATFKVLGMSAVNNVRMMMRKS